MSEYYRLVNYTKGEYIDPHSVGMQAHMGGVFTEPISPMFLYLLANGSYDGGKYYGHWARNNVEIIGDSEPTFYDLSDDYIEITEKVYNEMDAQISEFPEEYVND
jgi:hypothetical protein